MIKRFQNRIAESRSLLLFASLYGLIVWLLRGVVGHAELWSTFGVFVVCVYMMVELNNRNALLRVYSRMVSSSFILISSLMVVSFDELRSFVVLLLSLSFIMVIFRTYQKRSMTGTIYLAYLFIGIISLLWPPILYALPVMWLICSAFLFSFNFKNLIASLFGVLTPYWLLIPYVFYFQRWGFVNLFTEQLLPSDSLIVWFSNPVVSFDNILQLDNWQVLVLVFDIVLSILVIIHYFNKSYEDKIQVRMYYHSFILLSVVLIICIALVILLPFDIKAHFPILMLLLSTCLSPLLAHYVTFTRTILTNISVILIILLSAVLTAVQLVPVEYLPF